MGLIIIISVIVIIYVATHKSPPTPPKSQNIINRYRNAMTQTPVTQQTLAEINEAAEDLIDEYLYYYRDPKPENNKECWAILQVLNEYPFSYSGTKYRHLNGLLVEDVIKELREGMRPHF